MGVISSQARVDILGCWVDRADICSAVAKLEELIAAGGIHRTIIIYASSDMIQLKDRNYRAICAEAALVLHDGVPLLRASSLGYICYFRVRAKVFPKGRPPEEHVKVNPVHKVVIILGTVDQPESVRPVKVAIGVGATSRSEQLRTSTKEYLR